MDPAVTCLLVLAAVVALFLWNRFSVGVVAVAATLSLYVTGLLDAGEALAGFGDPVVIFVAALFVVSEALDATGITAWAGDRLTALAGTGRRVLVASVMGAAAVLTAVISPNGSVAALLLCRCWPRRRHCPCSSGRDSCPGRVRVGRRRT